MATNYYDMTRARGGKDDSAIESELNKLGGLRAGNAVQIQIDRTAPWQGEEVVDIQNGGVLFVGRKDYTFSPVAIQATTRVLQRHGLRGLYRIEVSGNTIAIRPLSSANDEDARFLEESSAPFTAVARPSKDADDGELWELALANPVPLFLASEDDLVVALFDDKGFFLSNEAERLYDILKSKPHIYVARLASNDAIYVGISNQQGGRWKRSHAYHLGGLAYEILGTTDGDQNHSHWVESWFIAETFRNTGSVPEYGIRMRQLVVISFHVPEPSATKEELESTESRLVSLARKKGLKVLNILK